MFRFEQPDATTAAVAEGEAMIRLIVKLVVIDLALLVLCGAVIRATFPCAPAWPHIDNATAIGVAAKVQYVPPSH